MQTLSQHRITVALEQEGLDAARISAISTALAIHIIAAGMLMAPTQLPAPQTIEQNVPITFVLPEVKQPEAPPIQKEQVKKEPVQAQVMREIVDVRKPTTKVTPDIGPVTDSNIVAASTTSNEGTVAATSGGEVGPVVDPAPNREPVTLAGAQLAYASNPAPAYPRNALLSQAQGTVILEVTVDETGKPVSVVIASSSGNRDLDRAAREQVLRAWRFHPAMQNGRAVRAIGRVPVAFTLN